MAEESISYENKIILAPMVRCSTLAFRLLALEYGADIVYTEEIVDFRMLNAQRRVNETTNLIEYYVGGIKKPIFQTCDREKGKVVFQLGTCDGERALKICKIVENDVAAIDLNMGCPKEFSVHGGMGAALLKKPDTVKEILTTLVNGCKVPITCKIRCLPSLEETLSLCKMIEDCGVKAIAVHGRFTHERSRNPNHDEYIQKIAKSLRIPVIANGGSNVIKNYEDIDKFRQSCGASSVMLARVAMWNCSIFRREGLIHVYDVIKRFLTICLETDNFFFNTKYAVQQMLHEELQGEYGTKVLASLCGEEIYQLFGMLDQYNETIKMMTVQENKQVVVQVKKRRASNEEVDGESNGLDGNEHDESAKKQKTSVEIVEEKNAICMHAKFYKKDFRDGSVTPKSILHKYTHEHDLPTPIYHTEENKVDRIFKSVVQVDNVYYTTPYWELSKRATEQAAAIVCLETLGIDYKQTNKTESN